MTRATRISIGTVFVAAALLAPIHASAATQNAACAKAKGESLVQNGSYRVFQRVKKQPKKYYTSLTRIYSCSLHSLHFKQVLIAKWGNNLDGTQDVRDGELAGTYVLLRVESETGVTDEIGLLTSDLRKGGARQFFPPDERVLGESYLASDGGVLAVFSPGAPSATLHAFDADGDHTLATGAFSEPGVGSNHAYWQDSAGLHAFAFSGAAAASSN
jgi:hypothetical protein